MPKSSSSRVPNKKYFVVLRTTADKAELGSQKICVRRRLRNLPALYLNVTTLTKFEQPKKIDQSISSALDALETSVRLNYQHAVAVVLEEEQKFDLLQEIGQVAGE
ncbi:hypothetical protein EVAR_99271_1 [Eumeta japonica]|uniref:Uncharacterized protein n=1 Tax=Eumeta variegata TaxID=151549 RepID=A0A4C1ZAJ6_EUMVA|nr:hypothetical protein EVAR_99271_1 [Eumeta japonica]